MPSRILGLKTSTGGGQAPSSSSCTNIDVLMAAPELMLGFAELCPGGKMPAKITQMAFYNEHVDVEKIFHDATSCSEQAEKWAGLVRNNFAKFRCLKQSAQSLITVEKKVFFNRTHGNFSMSS